MPRKRGVWWLAEAMRLDADDRTSREIAELLRKRAKPGQKPPGQSTVFTKIKETKAKGAPIAVAPAPPARSERVDPSPSDASADPSPTADSPQAAAMTPDEVVRWLSDAIRDCQELAESCKSAGDGPGQARAIRLATQLAAPMARLQARTVDEGDVVRVKSGDIQAAADRAVLALHSLADRVIAERATWPKCGACGSHVGKFAAGDTSPLRALFERVARAAT